MDPVNQDSSTTSSLTNVFSVLSLSSPPVPPLPMASEGRESSSLSLMCSSSLPILPSTTTECLEGLENSETQPPPGTNVRETMEKAYLPITSTLQSDTTTPLPLTSSDLVMLSHDTSLPVVPPLTS